MMCTNAEGSSPAVARPVTVIGQLGGRGFSTSQMLATACGAAGPLGAQKCWGQAPCLPTVDLVATLGVPWASSFLVCENGQKKNVCVTF